MSDYGANEGTALCICGAGLHERHPDRCAHGHPWKGYPGPALVHGGQEKALFRRADVQEAMHTKRAAIEADLGVDLATIHRDQVSAYVQVNVLRQSMFDLFVRTGAKGRAYERFLAVLDREIRLAQALGLERRSKPVADPLAYVEGRTDA
jgi:hypothetical protein